MLPPTRPHGTASTESSPSRLEVRHRGLLRFALFLHCVQLPLLLLVSLSKELRYWLDVEKVKRSSGSTQRRYPRKVSLDPLLWDRLEAKVPMNAQEEHGADSRGVSKHHALEAQVSLKEKCFHNWEASPTKSENVSGSLARTRGRDAKTQSA